MDTSKVSGGQRKQFIERVQRVQKVADIKKTNYYSDRGLTEEEQESKQRKEQEKDKKSANVKKLYEEEKAKVQNTKIYNKLNKAEEKTEDDELEEEK